MFEFYCCLNCDEVVIIVSGSTAVLVPGIAIFLKIIPGGWYCTVWILHTLEKRENSRNVAPSYEDMYTYSMDIIYQRGILIALDEPFSVSYRISSTFEMILRTGR